MSTHTSQKHLETYEIYRVMTITMIIDIYSYFLYLIWGDTAFPVTQALTSVPRLNILCRSPTEPVKKTQSVPRCKHTLSRL
jgi:hypothetical protein